MLKKRYAVLSIHTPAVRDDGGAISFVISTAEGDNLELRCTPDVVPQIVALLSGAMEAAHRKRDKSPSRKVQLLESRRSEISGNRVNKVVELQLFVTQHFSIGFGLPADHARHISSELARMAALIDPAEKNALS